MMHTVAEAGDILGLSVRTVQKWCQKLGVPKHGVHSYVISAESLEAIRQHSHDRPGRPRVGD